jgi:predicted PurR-regulated permease PerM
MPVFLFYILKDWEKLKPSFYSGLPDWARLHTQQILRIIDRVFGRFMRAQLVLGALVGTTTLIVLMALQVPFAWVLGPLAGLLEMVPTFGPWISAIAAILVTLATAPDKVLWVAGLFGAVQLLENLFLVPRIQGGFLRIHPAISIVLLVLGSYVAGLWGVVLILPLTATAKELYLYARSVVSENQAQPVPAQPVPAQPVSAQPVPAQPVSAQPVPAQPVPAQPACQNEEYPLRSENQ